MARLFWLVVTLAAVGLLVAGASWAAAYSAVAKLLGNPPPQMGASTTHFVWDGVPQIRHHPRAWQFTFGPTLIPGARHVQIFVSPSGKILRTDPVDLAARLQAFHKPSY